MLNGFLVVVVIVGKIFFVSYLLYGLFNDAVGRSEYVVECKDNKYRHHP
jgi:hypothetical protein